MENQIGIELGNIGSKQKAERIREKIQGQTFFNFQVFFGPCAGNYPVTVTADNEAGTEDEARQMLMFLMASVM